MLMFKADNEKIYYIMEALNDAINASKKVSFQYFTYNVRKEQKLKYDGYTYAKNAAAFLRTSLPFSSLPAFCISGDFPS